MRLIDADKLLEKMSGHCDICNYDRRKPPKWCRECDWREAMDIIDDMDEVEVEPVQYDGTGMIDYSVERYEARKPHFTTLKYLVNGTEVTIPHPECPRCIENGLMLWDAEIEIGQAYCKRCGQAVKWNE